MVKTERVIVVDRTAAPGTKARTGRPPVNGIKAMSKTERQRRYRAKQRAAAETDEERGKRHAKEAVAELCESRGIVEGSLEHILAIKAVNAIADNEVALAVKLLDVLPPRAQAVVGHRTMSAQAAKEQLFELVTNAIAADLHDLRQRAERGETLSEREALTLRLHEIDEAEAGGAVAPPVAPLALGAATLPAGAETAPLAAGAAGATVVTPISGIARGILSNAEGTQKTPVSIPAAPITPTAPTAITPSEADITPPGERAELYRKPVYADDPKPKPGRNTVIDAKPEPAPPPPRPADPTKPGGFDASEHGRLWREYCRTHPYDVLL
jgi:hypothetical protein